MALPGYLEDTAKDYAAQATKAYTAPVDTSKFTGAQFVAGEDPLQTRAIDIAEAGVGSYAPFLSAAQPTHVKRRELRITALLTRTTVVPGRPADPQKAPLDDNEVTPAAATYETNHHSVVLSMASPFSIHPKTSKP